MANHAPYFSQANSQYTLGYGMRLDKGTAPEFAHPHVSVTLPDGSKGDMTLHVINGTPDEIKARLLESVDAFFEIYAAPDHSEQHVARLKEEFS